LIDIEMYCPMEIMYFYECVKILMMKAEIIPTKNDIDSCKICEEKTVNS